MKDPQKNMFGTFFNKEGLDLLENRLAERGDVPSALLGPPVMPDVELAAEKERQAYWRTLRAFFRSGKGGGIMNEKGDRPFPALLWPYWHKKLIQRDYPCWIGENQEGEQEGWPLSQLLMHSIDQLQLEEGQHQLLLKQVPKLMENIRQKTELSNEAYKAFPLIEETIADLQQKQKNDNVSALLKQLKEYLPTEGFLVPYSLDAPVQLLVIGIQLQVNKARQALREEIEELTQQLKDLLTIEQSKGMHGRSPESLHNGLKFADTMLDFEELSNLLPASSTLPEERLQRIGQILATLEQSDVRLFGEEAMIVLAKGHPVVETVDWKRSFPKCALTISPAGALSATLADVFDNAMKKVAQLFAAIRMAKLELADAYATDLHADFFTHFNWRNFNELEWKACAPAVLIADAGQIITDEFEAFSSLLASNRPVKLLLEKSVEPIDKEEKLFFRQEIGALAIAHRNPYVYQTSISRSKLLFNGLLTGIKAAVPAIFHFLSGRAGKGMDPHRAHLWMSAAIEGREFPGFVFNSEKGPKWGNRFDIQNNPDIDKDWPLHQLTMIREGEQTTEELPFTFADFAAQDDRFSHFFHIVSPRFWTDELVPLADYLLQHGAEMQTNVPFVWLVNKNNELQKAAVALPLVLMCQERLDFWHYLQENAGIHNYHAELAIETIRAELKAEADQKIEQQKAEFENTLQEVKQKAAREAIEKLASVLLELDAASLFEGQMEVPATPAEQLEPAVTKEAGPKEPPGEFVPPEPVSQAPEKEVVTEEYPKDTAAPQEEGQPLGDAWIDTPLCTSCYECIDQNNVIFQYNEEKQAYVADPDGGPFADIVLAAENCPVSIIHPGSPHNPDEPNLNEWIERAKPFQ